MKSVLKMAMRLIGEKNRHRVYRKMAAVPAEYLNPQFQVQIAKSKEDLEAAYALLHDCYVGIKILDPQPSGLRCYLFSFLPTSTIIVAKLNGKVVGTVSAIKDSRSGLPSDKEFKQQNNEFRRKEKVIVEASALAVAPEFRGNHAVAFLLMKHLYNYCKNCFHGDYMVAAVHPRAEDFYKALWQFEKNGEPVGYNSLKGAAAIHISLDLSTEHFQNILQTYGTDDPMKNIGLMIISKDPRFIYPPQREGQSIHPVITPEVLKYFCLGKPEVWARMKNEEKKILIQVYSTYFGSEVMNDFAEQRFQAGEVQNYRTPVKLSAVVESGNQIRFCDILDLTEGGCYVSWQGELPASNQIISISFRFEGKNYSAQGKIAWKNANRSLHCRRGFGIQFTQKIPALKMQLKHWLYEAHDLTQQEKHLSIS